jgi:cytochrome c
MDLEENAANWNRGPYTYCGRRLKPLVSAAISNPGQSSIMSSSFEFNKIAGAVLATALAVFGLKELSGLVYHAEHPEKQGYVIEVAEASEGDHGGGEEQPKPLAELLKAANAAAGEKAAVACKACHDFAKGGPNKTGPNLWDIIERPHAAIADYKYSDGMLAKKAEPWTYEALFAFLEAPTKAIPGTKMALATKSPTKRADILAYLQTLSDSPKPFPAQ